MGFNDPMDEETALKIARASQPAVHTECWRALKTLLRKHDCVEGKIVDLLMRVIGRRMEDA